LHHRKLLFAPWTFDARFDFKFALHESRNVIRDSNNRPSLQSRVIFQPLLQSARSRLQLFAQIFPVKRAEALTSQGRRLIK
jgi:hypothetical protein